MEEAASYAQKNEVLEGNVREAMKRQAEAAKQLAGAMTKLRESHAEE